MSSGDVGADRRPLFLRLRHGWHLRRLEGTSRDLRLPMKSHKHSLFTCFISYLGVALKAFAVVVVNDDALVFPVIVYC